MDVNAYIESGILETYILGIGSDQENREVNCMRSIYPEIDAELKKHEHTYEHFALKIAKNPPAALKEKILKEIAKSPKESTHPKVIALPKSGNFMGILAVAASIFLVIGFSFYVLVSNQEIDDLNEQIALMSTINDERTKYEKLLHDKNVELEKQEHIALQLADRATQLIDLKGTNFSPESSFKIFWNPNTKQLFLNALNIPQLQNNEQLQLWAIVDGLPVDMGLIPIIIDSRSIEVMPFEVENPQAFAITIEPKGGKESPTLEKMIAMGAV